MSHTHFLQCTVLQQQCKEQKDQLEAANETIASVQSEKGMHIVQVDYCILYGSQCIDTSLLESSSHFSQLQETTQVQIEQFQAEVLHLKAQLEQEVCNGYEVVK